MITAFTLDGDRPAGEVLEAAAQVEPRLGVGFAERAAVVLDLEEVRTDAGADERMPLASFPVVVGVDPERNLPQRIGRFIREPRIGQPEVGAQAGPGREVVLEQGRSEERRVGKEWRSR